METTPKRGYRWLALLLLLLVFGGLLTYTTMGVTFDVSGTSKSEYSVLQDSLTHSVQRAADGKLISPQASKTKDAKGGKADKACPT
ncbi:MAG: hypothetical protein ABFE07_24860 [Armatimonadia bacterium]